MMEQSQIDFVVNHRFFIPGAVLAGLIILLVAIKLLLGSRASSAAQSLEDASKSSGRKKKSKKQRTAIEKKGPDSPKPKKDTRKNEMESLFETKKRIIEEEKSDKKKDGKNKAKSKKKKSSNNQVKVETIPHSTAGDINFEAGEWKTVSTKEQREQLKREKRKLEENALFSLDSTIDKNDPPFVQPLYKPTTNISAIAKGIAPRFARAAGEQWQEKPPVTLPYQSKRPMPPATVPGTKPQPSTSKTSTTVNQQPWSPSQGSQIWPREIGSTWSTSPIASGANNLANDFMTWQHGDSTTLLSMATSGDKAPVSGWPQGGGTWQSPGSRNTWDVGSEDWVHVNGQNGRNANSSVKTWIGGDSKIRTHTAADKHEEWTLEPEGFPLKPAPMDPDDPWNFEVVGTDDTGDWAAPASSWDNTTAEWTAPVAVKSQPVYEDEYVPTSKAASTLPTPSGLPLPPQSVVGAGPDFLTQAAAGQGQGKKSRRRRKKKQTATGEPEQPSTPEFEIAKTEIAEKEPKPETSAPEVKETAPEVSDDWTIPKVSKKRKNKARKAD